MPNDERYFPKIYPVEIEPGSNEGDSAAGSISLDNDFILTGIRHQIVDDGSGTQPPTQDGAYRIDWSIQETTKFYKGTPPMADVQFGSVRHGIWKDLDAPIKIGQNRTLQARVINTMTRANPTLKIEVLFAGLEPLGAGAPDKF